MVEHGLGQILGNRFYQKVNLLQDSVLSCYTASPSASYPVGTNATLIVAVMLLPCLSRIAPAFQEYAVASILQAFHALSDICGDSGCSVTTSYKKT